MNEFTEQFVLESRELVEQAASALARLEHSPHDAEQLDALFRAFHTLKGGASIVEFAAMEHAVHAAEDVLSHARAAKRPIDAALISNCLACLDQVTRWLEQTEKSGDIPTDAETQGNAIVARMGGGTNDDGKSKSIAARQASATWLEDFLKLNRYVEQAAKTAVRYIPRPDSFFRGEDPLAVIGALPQLLALELQPIEQWPALEVVDPYESILIYSALSGATSEEISAYLEERASECEIVALDHEATVIEQPLTENARNLLKAQIALLNETQKQSVVGRVASAGRAAVNVMRYFGQADAADLLARATEKSASERDAAPLKDQIAKLIMTQVTPPTPDSLSASSHAPLAAKTLRVDADRVDALVRLTGELIVAKNAIGHATKLAQDGDNALAITLKNNHGVLEHITSELQRAVLGLRVLPLRAVLQRFPRLVREMSASLNKPTKLLIEGDDTEADKAIVEMLFEPLLHVVRNAMDHGIETAEIRTARNKASVATLVIRASRQADRVRIEVSDDGGGIDVQRVRDVAIKRGIATVEALDAMTEADVIDLVFAPGFSTASAVTEVSGRGVGMDAVRTAVARVGGKVTIESASERGTTVIFTLPFSVMLTQVMTVEAGGQLFGIPLDAVVETIRIPTEAMTRVGAAQAIVRRNRTVPIVELANILSVRERAPTSSEAIIVITAFAGQLGGLHVDRVGERMEVMLKPLEGLLAGIPGVTGTTILGDGRVLLVLDVEGVSQ